MASLEDLEARLTAVEGQMAEARQDSAAARVLAGAADRDVSEFRQTLNAHTKVLGALRETQVEDQAEARALRAEVTGIKGEVAGIKGEVAGIKGEVAGFKGEVAGFKGEVAGFKGETRDAFAKVNTGMERITTLLQAVIDKG